ncbi:MAG: iron ABC transporter permease [Pseudomonadota bacterium]|jgi:iron(III) transport system permease protein|nr:iron ABC transporter permease [Pseudomonadota bacterium]NLX31000.1 iron ABC transporter permease [Deltaproteobacteria bacterium]HNU86445.1 iron ABC transporter permease [Syntrophales bacterium]HNZ35874.1 iron ABC transporter permease [Syntrophales bacterium]HOF74068.1 iron ABC transporter permease [Syntrophales bacterium]
MQKTSTALTPGLIAIVGFLTLCPVVMLILGSFSGELGAFGAFTLEKYVAAYTDPAFAEILVSTVIFTLGSALVATGLALFLAYLNTRTNIPGKFIFGVISLIPMMVPHILFAVSWVLLLNPSNGMINLFLRQLGLEGAALNIYSLTGMILVEGLLDLPIAYLVVAPAMSAFDVALEESSRVCGASNARTLIRVTLPVLRPAILAALTLVIVRSLASFAVPSVIGMPGRIYVLATHIYSIVATGYAADYGMAAAVGMSALAASITLIVLYRRLTREGEKYVTISSRGYRPSVIDLKGARYPLFAVVVLISFVLIVLPVLVLFYTSLVPYVMTPGAKAFAAMSWRHWATVLKDPVSLLALKNSLYLGIGGATLGIVLSFFVAYVIVKVRSKASGLLESLSFLSFSFPGIVVGIGFMWFFVQTPLYSTIWALLIGYIATYLPYGLRPLTSAFVQIHGHLEESSRVCGGGPLYTMRRIVLPLLVPGIASGWILMATMFVRELSLSVVLSRPGTEVLAVQILRFAEDGLWGRLSALGILMIFISTALVVLANGIAGRLSKKD